MGLEAHEVIYAPHRVVPPQLHHGVRLFLRLGVRQATGLERTKAEGLLPPPGHDLHGHTALEDVLVLKAMHRGLLGLPQFLPERKILLLRQGAVDVVRRALVVPGGKPGAVHVDALKGHQRRGGVVEVQIPAVREMLRNALRQCIRRERPGSHDDLPLGRHLRDLPFSHGDVGVVANGIRNGLGKGHPVHRQGAPSGHPMLVGTPQDQRV